MNINRNWFAASPLANYPTSRQDEERRELRRAMLATAVLIVLGLLATAILPRPDLSADAALQPESGMAPIFP